MAPAHMLQRWAPFKKDTLKQILIILILTICGLTSTIGQTLNDSIYNSWWANKDRSIFNDIDSGRHSGTTTGYLQVVQNNNDTLVLDFQTTKTTLDIEKDPNQVYDNSTKHYLTKTTSGKTTLTYDTYALANILTIILNGQYYKIGTIDGASDMPILGLTFNYCNEQAVEFLTLFVTKPLQLTTTRHIMQTQKMNYSDAKKIAKTLTLLPGSTLIMTIRK